MSFITDLMAKGVSRTGAVEVLLGRPLNLATDRIVLSRLAIPAARESLSQPPAVPSLVGAPDRRIARIVVATSGASAPSAPTTQGTPIIPTTTTTTPVDPRITALNTSIRNVERQIQALIQQLLKLAVPPPGMPLAAWEAQVKMLRAMIQSSKNVLAMLMQQLAGLTGTSQDTRGSSNLGSLGEALGEVYDLESNDDSKPTGTTGGGA